MSQRTAWCDPKVVILTPLANMCLLRGAHGSGSRGWKVRGEHAEPTESRLDTTAGML